VRGHGKKEREREREEEKEGERKREKKERHARTCGREVFICVWLERLVHRCYTCTIHAYVVYIEDVTTSIVIAHKPRNYPYIQRRTVFLPPPLLGPAPALNLLCLSESSQLPRILGENGQDMLRIRGKTRIISCVNREQSSALSFYNREFVNPIAIN